MIKRFRFTRSFIFTFRILLRYVFVFLINKLLPYSWGEALLKWTHRRVAKKIRKYIFRLRGLYIKLGQLLGVMSNLFVREFIEKLEDLQDRVPAVPYDVIKNRFINQWGKEPTEIFHTFDKQAIAAASLGQVHVATLEDGTKLAVKALYPGVEKFVKRDLNSVRAIAKLINFFFPYFDTEVIYTEFADLIKKEINYDNEVENISKFKKNFAGMHNYVFPNIVREHSCNTILTTEFIEGIKINDVEALEEAGLSPKKVSNRLTKAFCKMIFEDQFFHADPHPGNFFVLPDHRIAFVDFGAVEYISSRSRLIIKNLAKAIVKRDIPRILDSLEQMGVLSKRADKEDIETMIAYRYDKIANLKIESYKNLNFKDFNNLEDLKSLDLRLSEIMQYFQVPHNLLLLGRTISLLSGLAVDLNPKLNIFQIAWPFIKDFAFGSELNMKTFMEENFGPFTRNIVNLPEYALKTMDTVNSGKIKVTLKDFNKDLKKLYRLGHQFIYTIFIITFLAFGLVLFLNKKENLMRYCLYTAGGFASILVLSIFKNRKF